MQNMTLKEEKKGQLSRCSLLQTPAEPITTELM